MKRGEGYYIAEIPVDGGLMKEARDDEGHLITRFYFYGAPGEDVFRRGGPAVVNFFPSGAVECEQWMIDGASHRVDGPASVYYEPDGRVKIERWRFRGKLPRLGVTREQEYEFFIECLYRLSIVELREEFEQSSYAAYLESGHAPERILTALAAGVWRTESVGLFLDGAPVEWIRAFEEGGTS